MARLGDVATYINGYAFKPSDWSEDGLPIIRIQDLTGNSYQCNRFNGKYNEKYEVTDGDVLISWSASLGVYVWKGGKALLNQHIFKVVFDKEVINKSFFVHQVENILEKAAGEAHGATMKHLTKPVFDALPFYLPELEKQNKIAGKLDKVCYLIALRKQHLEKFDELIKSRFIELFGDLHSTTFPKCKMAEICGIKHGYAFSGEFFTEEDNNILLVTPGNFKVGGGFQEKKCKFFTGAYSKEYVLNSGDLIVTMTDLSKNMDTLGYSAIVPCTNRVYLHNQRIGLFVNMSEKINSVFLMYFMQTNEYRDSIIASATGSTVHHTSPSKILDCDVFVPPIELQNQFADFVEQTEKSKFAVQKSLEQLETLKKALMQEYFG